MVKLSVLSFVVLCSSVWGATPETSRLFEKCVDAESGVVSYKLKTGLAGENQQSFYFTQQSMTADGRFLLFNASKNEFAHGPKPDKKKTLKFIDFEKDEIGEIPLPEKPKTGMGYLDCDKGEYWFINENGLFRRDLALAPDKDVPMVAPLPAALVAEGAFLRYAMHLTLSADRTKAFLDAALGDDTWVEGVIDIPSKSWTRWHKSDFELAHGQINPVLNDVAICALQFTPPEKKSSLRHWNCSKPGGVCTRIHLVRPGGETMVKIPTHATHEHWAQDGKGFIWCCNNNTVTNGHGVWYRTLEGQTPERIYPGTCTHATMSGDNRYVVFDDVVGKGFRGSGWRVGFYDRTTQRTVFIRSKNEPLTTREKPSVLHPDPHPQFVCRDRYIISTMNNADGHMDLLVTPVAPLRELTAACR